MTRQLSARRPLAAIAQGLEADGDVMDWTVPRWQMSEADLDALIEYLKTLE